VTIRVFVNAVAIDLDEGATALDCVHRWRTEEGEAVSAGTRIITDSRGLPISADSPAQAGSIYRTVPKRQHGARETPT
jgi:hypothetical protein